MSYVISCEQVSAGHPDKICDQIADAIVTDCMRHDPKSRVAMEVLIKDNHIVIAGEMTSKHTPDYKALVLVPYRSGGGMHSQTYGTGLYQCQGDASAERRCVHLHGLPCVPHSRYRGYEP